jgi:hypothetical protein
MHELAKLNDIIMKNIINSIKNSLENKNWHSALILSLIVPDICGKLEGSGNSSKRYLAWFNKYLGKKYQNFLSGDDCYALRCSYLHAGSGSIEKQRAKDVLDHFVFIPNGAHCNKFSNCYFGNSKYDGKEFLQLSVYQFCQDIIEATQQWFIDVSKDQNIQKNIAEMLEIYEEGFSIGNALRIE